MPEECSGIIQASHACDPGSTPGVRMPVLGNALPKNVHLTCTDVMKSGMTHDRNQRNKQHSHHVPQARPQKANHSTKALVTSKLHSTRAFSNATATSQTKRTERTNHNKHPVCICQNSICKVLAHKHTFCNKTLVSSSVY